MTTSQAPGTSADPAGKQSDRRTRRRRTPLMIALFLVTVALLLAAADWLARTVAQNRLADQIHQQTENFGATHGRDRRDGVSAASPARTVRRGRHRISRTAATGRCDCATCTRSCPGYMCRSVTS